MHARKSGYLVMLQAAKELGLSRNPSVSGKRRKLQMSDAAREAQRRGNFQETDNDGNVDPKDGIRQGPGVYSGR